MESFPGWRRAGPGVAAPAQLFRPREGLRQATEQGQTAARGGAWLTASAQGPTIFVLLSVYVL